MAQQQQQQKIHGGLFRLFAERNIIKHMRIWPASMADSAKVSWLIATAFVSIRLELFRSFVHCLSFAIAFCGLVVIDRFITIPTSIVVFVGMRPKSDGHRIFLIRPLLQTVNLLKKEIQQFQQECKV